MNRRWHADRNERAGNRRAKGASQRKPPCETCVLILQAFRATAVSTKLNSSLIISLGRVVDVMGVDCSKHQALLLMAMGIPPGLVKDNDFGSNKYQSIELWVRRNYILFCRPGRGNYVSREWMMSNDNRHASYRGFGRAVDAKWIDVRLIQKWILTCDDKHGKTCRDAFATTRIAQYRPRLLIDTRRKCLTKMASEESYVALSYVWGSTPNLTTLQANLELFQHPGSLGYEELASQIPKFVRDAMALTELVQERYLWVDSLCIVQDDKETSHTEITKMASIYANAALTIVAANGEDANHGLRGMRGISLSRSLSQRTAKLLNGVKIVELRSPSLSKTTWSQRGWTFQENLFSQRKVVGAGEDILFIFQIISMFSLEMLSTLETFSAKQSLTPYSRPSATTPSCGSVFVQNGMKTWGQFLERVSTIVLYQTEIQGARIQAV